jgi:hypothetical protein
MKFGYDLCPSHEILVEIGLDESDILHVVCCEST